MIEKWSRLISIVIALTCCWEGQVQAQRNKYGGPAGAATSLGIPPRYGDYVIPDHEIPQPPFPLRDLKGGVFRRWYFHELSCEAKHDRPCGGTERMEIPDDWEYCTHNVAIQAWNHAWYRVQDVGTNHLTIEVDVRGTNRSPWSYVDRVGGNFVATVLIGLVPKGQYSLDRCLPRRQWASYCHGNTHKTGQTCIHNDRCATMAAFDVPFDQECAGLEFYRRTR